MITDVKPIFDQIDEQGRRRIAVETSELVCSSRIDIVINGETISEVSFMGGCGGNTRGVAALCKGMKVKDAIARLEGIDCAGRGTSCPDQLARALKIAL